MKSYYRCERRRHPRNDCLQQDRLDILCRVWRTLHRLKSANDCGRLHIKEVPTRSLACRHLPHTFWKVMVIKLLFRRFFNNLDELKIRETIYNPREKYARLDDTNFCSVVIVIAFIIAIGGKAAVAMPSVILAVLPVLLGIYFWITVYTTFTQIKVFWVIHSAVYLVMNSSNPCTLDSRLRRLTCQLE